jgi:outer membrane protein OmpA-like peptidoglycan-associated protein
MWKTTRKNLGILALGACVACAPTAKYSTLFAPPTAAPAPKSIQSVDLQSAANASNVDERRKALLQLGIETADLIQAGMTVGLVDGDPVVQIPTELFFNANQAQLKTESAELLSLLTQVLQARKDTYFTLFAHGPRSGDLPILEAARGLGLLNALVTAGLSAQRIEVMGGFSLDFRDQIGTAQPIQGDALYIRFTPRMTNQHHTANAKSKPQSLKAMEAKN